MRTHLLRTFYPSPAAEPDTGSAANDTDYDPATANNAPSPRTMVLVTSRESEKLSREDEYALGGYAGI